MIEIEQKFKPFFYKASIMLGLEVAFFISFITDPTHGWAIYGSILALAASIPNLVGACLGFITGYEEPAKHLLRAGMITFVLWFFLALLSYSIWASVLFACMSLLSYKMLQYHHIDKKSVKDDKN